MCGESQLIVLNVQRFIEKWESQVRKGLLEFVVLLCLHEKEYYGYELINDVKQFTTMDISEGTIYPLLNRLKKDALVEARWVEQPSGVPRKYYQITQKGEQVLAQMEETWERLTSSIARMRLVP